MLLIGNSRTERALRKEQDNFTPNWDVEWQNVTLDQNVRLHIAIYDVDVKMNDDVPSFEVSNAYLKKALREGDVLQVPVGASTFNQVLFAGVSVRLAQ